MGKKKSYPAHNFGSIDWCFNTVHIQQGPAPGGILFNFAVGIWRVILI